VQVGCEKRSEISILHDGPATHDQAFAVPVNGGIPAERMAVRRYDAFATFLSKSTLRFKAMTRPSTPSRWRIEWNSERCTAS
jgi:hypothetical protein